MRRKFAGSLHLFFLSGSAAVTAACGAHPDGGVEEGATEELHQEIIGGSTVSTTTRRTLGLVDYGCSGSLVHPDWMITATHCLNFGNETSVGARIPRPDGTDDIRQSVNFIQLGTSDVSLVQLGPGAPGNQWPTVSRGIYTGTPASLVGQTVTCYGRGWNAYDTDGVGLVGSGYRQLSRTVDSVVNGTDLIVNSNAAGSEVTAPGDSGGLCMFNNLNAAIVSWGDWDCVDKTTPQTCKDTITRVKLAGWRTTGEFAGYIANMPSMNQSLQIVGQTGSFPNGRLMHTLRSPNGSWTGFGDVESRAGDIGSITLTAAHTDNDGRTHVLAANENWTFYHAIRTPDGNWTPFGNVETAASDIGNANDLSLTQVGNTMHLVVTSQTGKLWHTIRFADGSWLPFGDVETATGEAGTFTRVSSAGDGEQLHVCALANTGRIHHALRFADGSWTSLNQLTSDQNLDVSCTVVAGELHVVRAQLAGVAHNVLHAVRNAAGGWTGWGNPAPNITWNSLFAVSSAEVGGDLHVMVSNSGRIYHSVRSSANGLWTGFGDVNNATGFGSTFGEFDAD